LSIVYKLKKGVPPGHYIPLYGVLLDLARLGCMEVLHHVTTLGKERWRINHEYALPAICTDEAKVGKIPE
jgi:hypothetical protein